MNTPNKLTVLRVLLVPLFLAFLLVGRIPAHYLLALIVFIAASVTDSLDGYLARKNSQVTTFGKFLDPLADKILVLSAMISFIELGLCGSLVVVIMIAREFMVTSLRLVAVSGDGTVIAARHARQDKNRGADGQHRADSDFVYAFRMVASAGFCFRSGDCGGSYVGVGCALRCIGRAVYLEKPDGNWADEISRACF